jgi:KaiC/GvpD/RAD55 family RecA-like ATPase
VSRKNQIIAVFGQAYRLRVADEEHGRFFILDALLKSHWDEWQKWDDPGHVANLMVKHCVVADHAEALHLLNCVYSDGKE